MISLAFPWALLALPLPLLVWWLSPPHRQRVPAIRFPFFRRIVEATEQTPQEGAVVVTRTRLQMVVAIAVWCLLVLSVAQPERLGEPIEVTKSARDVVIALDISGSMDAADFVDANGNRMQRLAGVKAVVRDFVADRQDDRMALIVFGSRAFLQAPLTDDTGTIIDLVDQTQVGMAGPHTALGDSIGLAIRTFENSEVEQRLLILLSDGSDTSSRMSPLNAAEIARSSGVEIFTIGVGDPKGTGENWVDTETLADIARRTGGAYFFASDLDGLSGIYARIDELNPRLVEVLSHRPRTALHGYLMALSALIGLVGLAVLDRGARVQRRAAP